MVLRQIPYKARICELEQRCFEAATCQVERQGGMRRHPFAGPLPGILLLGEIDVRGRARDPIENPNRGVPPGLPEYRAQRIGSLHHRSESVLEVTTVQGAFDGEGEHLVVDRPVGRYLVTGPDEELIPSEIRQLKHGDLALDCLLRRVNDDNRG